MSLTYNPLYKVAKEAEPVLAEIILKDSLFDGNVVNIVQNVKGGTVFTDADNTVTIQEYSSVLSPSGSISIADVEIYPKKLAVLVDFAMDDLRTSRFGLDMEAGAWNTISDEFTRTVLSKYSKSVKKEIEDLFWNGLTSSTKSAALGVTGTDNDLAIYNYVSGLTGNDKIDGIVSRLIYNSDRSDFANTVHVDKDDEITSTNIAEVYAATYAAIPTPALDRSDLVFYAPVAHRQLINIANSANQYRNIFAVDGEGNFTYNSIPVIFVPIKDKNILIAGLQENTLFITDLASDASEVKIGTVDNMNDKMFLKMVWNEYAHVRQDGYFTLYIGDNS